MGQTPFGIAFDGANIWVTNSDQNTVTEINPRITPQQQAAATLSLTSLGFGDQIAGSTSAPQSVTVANTGTAALTVAGIAITGANSPDYAWKSTCGSSVAIGASCAISVTFTPTGTGIRTASVTVTDIASNSPQTISLTGTGQQAAPAVSIDGIFPVDSNASTIQSGEWVSIWGSNLASGTAAWKGDFPTSLGGTSVKINGKAAYLSYVSPGQINLQAPDDTDNGVVPVVVTTAAGSSTATVRLAQFSPSLFLLDAKHVAGIISRSDGSGAYGGGTYDIVGPTGTSLGYPTVAAKAGDIVELYGTGLGPTSPAVPAGQLFSGASPTTNPVTLLLNNVSVLPTFAGLSGAGLYQINLTVPASLGTGDVSLVVTAGGVQTASTVVISLQ